jgi:predicted ATPase with chaperone activity
VPRSPHEQQEYTQALVALARNRPQLAAMGRAAQERVRSQFRLEQMGERVQALLLEARDMQQQQPQPISSAEVVQHSIEQAMASAIRDAHWAQQTNVSANTMRRRVRNSYWWLVEQGAWWLVPLTERLRFGKN